MDLRKRATKLLCSKLIIRNDARIIHRYFFEAFDRTMCDIMSYDDVDNIDEPFGGVFVILGGDFRQILPVIRKGCRQDIFASSSTHQSCGVIVRFSHLQQICVYVLQPFMSSKMR